MKEAMLRRCEVSELKFINDMNSLWLCPWDQYNFARVRKKQSQHTKAKIKEEKMQFL